MVDDDAAFLHVCSNSILTEDNALNDSCCREDHHYDVALFTHLSICTCFCTHRYELIYEILIEVCYHYVVTCLYKMLCHWASHDTKSDKSKFHCFHILSFL